MVRIDMLEVPGLNPLYLSSHPLDQVKLEAEFSEKITEFIHALQERMIKTVTLLLPEDETDLIAKYRAADLGVLHYPLENFSIPERMDSFDRLMEEIIAILAEESVLVHCRTGCGRTAMVAAGVLIKRGMRAPQAIHQVHLARPSSRPTVNQIQFLREYRSSLDGGELGA